MKDQYAHPRITSLTDRRCQRIARLRERGAGTRSTPVAVNDSYTTNEDSTLNVGGSGVRSNDNLAGLGNNADAIVFAGPSRGTLTLGENGDFRYVPSANFNGTDTFTYRLRYALVNFSNVATVTITVNPVNDAPTGVVNRSYTTAEDVPLSIPAPGVLASVTDPDGPVTAAVVANPSAAAGTLSLSANGAFTFNPAAGFSATPRSPIEPSTAAAGKALLRPSRSPSPASTIRRWPTPTPTPRRKT